MVFVLFDNKISALYIGAEWNGTHGNKSGTRN